MNAKWILVIGFLMLMLMGTAFATGFDFSPLTDLNNLPKWADTLFIWGIVVGFALMANFFLILIVRRSRSKN